MSRKSSGISAERELVHMFWQNNYAAMRVAGSGNVKYPSVDVIAGKPGRKLAVECKITQEEAKYFSEDDISQISAFSRQFGAEPWLAVKFKRFGWRFFSLEDVKSTKGGFKVSKELAETRGLLFEELV